MAHPTPTQVAVLHVIPDCDFCHTKAGFDSPVREPSAARVTWAYTCGKHYEEFATSNAAAIGTRLVKG